MRLGGSRAGRSLTVAGPATDHRSNVRFAEGHDGDDVAGTGRGSRAFDEPGARSHRREVGDLHVGRPRSTTAAAASAESGQALHDGARLAAAPDAREADAVRLLQVSLRALHARAAERA